MLVVHVGSKANKRATSIARGDLKKKLSEFANDSDSEEEDGNRKEMNYLDITLETCGCVLHSFDAFVRCSTCTVLVAGISIILDFWNA